MAIACSSAPLKATLGVAKATAEKKVAADETIAGQGGQAVIGLVRLLGIAREVAALTGQGPDASLSLHAPQLRNPGPPPAPLPADPLGQRRLRQTQGDTPGRDPGADLGVQGLDRAGRRL